MTFVNLWYFLSISKKHPIDLLHTRTKYICHMDHVFFLLVCLWIKRKQVGITRKCHYHRCHPRKRILVMKIRFCFKLNEIDPHWFSSTWWIPIGYEIVPTDRLNTYIWLIHIDYEIVPADWLNIYMMNPYRLWNCTNRLTEHIYDESI